MIMSLLREYIQVILQEKKFADFSQEKGEWIDVPSDEIAKHRPETDVDDELFDLIDTAYKPIGGHIKIQSAHDLPNKYRYFNTTDVDADPAPDAVVFGQKKGMNLKLGGMGHDGGKGKSESIRKMWELLKQPGTYAEVSGVPAVLAIRAGVPVITDEARVRALLKKDIMWVGKHPTKDHGPNTDGWYSRSIGGKDVHLKIMVGNV